MIQQSRLLDNEHLCKLYHHNRNYFYYSTAIPIVNWGSVYGNVNDLDFLKEESLAPKLFVEVDFASVTGRKCYNIRQV